MRVGMALLPARSLLFAQMVAHLLLLTAENPVRAFKHEGAVSNTAPDILTPREELRVESFQHVRRLVQSDANQALWDAANRGDVDGVEAALDAGADVNVILGEFGDTPLTVATLNGHLTVVEVLLDAGADTSIGDEQGSTPLMLAASGGNEDLVIVIVDAGADVDLARESDGFTALLFATTSNASGIAGILLDVGADPNKVNNDGNGPLHLVSVTIGEGSEVISEALLEAGADVDLVGRFGWTPLMWAASLGNAEVVEILLDGDADKDIAGDDGTAFDLICDCVDRPEGAEYLQCPAGGCDVEETIEEIVELLSD